MGGLRENNGVNLPSWRGDWALVTGASEGLGAVFAKALAKQGLSLVLVARQEQRLRDMAETLERSYGIRTVIQARNLASPGAAEAMGLDLRAQGVRVRLLINNAAAVQWGPIEQTPLSTLAETIQLNITAAVQLCAVFHADLASHPTSAVVNVCSVAAHQPTPFMTLYGAGKSFLRNFSLGLNGEWAAQGILVQTLMPGNIMTEMTARAGFPERLLRDLARRSAPQPPETVVTACFQGLARSAPLVYVWSWDAWLGRLTALAPINVLIRESAKIFAPHPRENETSSVSPAIARNQSCRICGFSTPIPRPEDFGQARGNTARFKNRCFTLWRCPECKSITSIDPVDFKDIYRDYPMLKQRLDFFARATFKNLLNRLIRAGLKPGHSILDYGCGVGVFVEWLKAEGFNDVTGFDPMVARYAASPVGRQFDCVVANDVLEHVENPREFLKEVAALVKPGGILYVGTADAGGVRDMTDLTQHALRLHQPFHRVLVTADTLDRLTGELNFILKGKYKRSYLDTLRPFCNYRAFDELSRALGYDMDRCFDPVCVRKVLINPRVLFFGLFGYFFPSADEPAVVFQKPGESAE